MRQPWPRSLLAIGLMRCCTWPPSLTLIALSTVPARSSRPTWLAPPCLQPVHGWLPDGVLVVADDGRLRDIWLQDEDIVTIPELSEVVLVTGEVAVPQVLIYRAGQPGRGLHRAGRRLHLPRRQAAAPGRAPQRRGAATRAQRHPARRPDHGDAQGAFRSSGIARLRRSLEVDDDPVAGEIAVERERGRVDHHVGRLAGRIGEARQADESPAASLSLSTSWPGTRRQNRRWLSDNIEILRRPRRSVSGRRSLSL